MYTLGTYLKPSLGRDALFWVLTLHFQLEFSFTPKSPQMVLQEERKGKLLAAGSEKSMKQ